MDMNAVHAVFTVNQSCVQTLYSWKQTKGFSDIMEKVR